MRRRCREQVFSWPARRHPTPAHVQTKRPGSSATVYVRSFFCRRKCMAETLVQFQNPVLSPQEDLYEARACASETPGGLWEGWIEFTPIAGGRVIRSGR